tara:strand:- start:2723 stop:4423 length:1701 start_codon:yes stop_codon:yes gene_type:complete
MKSFFLIFILLFFGCKNSIHPNNSFDDLSNAFVKWYYKNNPIEATKINLGKYNDRFKINNFKSKEQYLLDLNRFYFELTQINFKKMSKHKHKEYHRLEKFMLRLLFESENINPNQWTPFFEITQIEKGLRYLLNYNYISIKNKVLYINLRLDNIGRMLDNSLTNLFLISDKDYRQSIKKVDSIISLLDNIDKHLDYQNISHKDLISKSKSTVQRLKKYKKDLLGAKTESSQFDKNYTINNTSFSIMAEMSIDVNSLYKKAINNLRREQVKMFENCLPIYLKYEDEPVWAYYEDTLNVIKFVINKIEEKNELIDLSYVEQSYQKNIFSKFSLLKFNYYEDYEDYAFVTEDMDIVIPINLNGKLQVNIPKNLHQQKKYNKIDIDLLNAHNIYPGYLYFLYSINEPFTDSNNNGIWNEDEIFLDVNSNEEWDRMGPVLKNFPNVSMVAGLKRYAERIFIKTNNLVSKEHKIMHQRNVVKDMLKCISDIDYHVNDFESKDVEFFLKENSFLHDVEILNLINKLESNYFGYLSRKYIGYSKFMDLERDYFNSNQDKNYLKFYHSVINNGID